MLLSIYNLSEINKTVAFPLQWHLISIFASLLQKKISLFINSDVVVEGLG